MPRTYVNYIVIKSISGCIIKMPVISIEIVKATDERQMQKITKDKQRQKGARGTEAIVKG